jgi:hypothetical protein
VSAASATCVLAVFLREAALILIRRVQLSTRTKPSPTNTRVSRGIAVRVRRTPTCRREGSMDVHMYRAHIARPRHTTTKERTHIHTHTPSSYSRYRHMHAGLLLHTKDHGHKWPHAQTHSDLIRVVQSLAQQHVDQKLALLPTRRAARRRRRKRLLATRHSAVRRTRPPKPAAPGLPKTETKGAHSCRTPLQRQVQSLLLLRGPW